MVRHHHRIAPAIVLTLALAVAAPASARFDLNPVVGKAHSATQTTTNVCSEACSGGGYPSLGRYSSVGGYSVKHVAAVPPPTGTANLPGNPTGPAVARVTASSDGFHWGDAGIGAGGAVALMVLVAGGVLVTTSNRRRGARASA
jgi:hypothetical protein